MATLFMLAGALPFAWYVRVMNGGGLRSEQVQALVATLGIVILVLTAWRVVTAGTPISKRCAL